MGQHTPGQHDKQLSVWQLRDRLLPDVKVWYGKSYGEDWMWSACLCGYGYGGTYYRDGGELHKEVMHHFATKHRCKPWVRRMSPSHTLKAAARRHRLGIYYDFH